MSESSANIDPGTIIGSLAVPAGAFPVLVSLVRPERFDGLVSAGPGRELTSQAKLDIVRSARDVARARQGQVSRFKIGAVEET